MKSVIEIWIFFYTLDAILIYIMLRLNLLIFNLICHSDKCKDIINNIKLRIYVYPITFYYLFLRYSYMGICQSLISIYHLKEIMNLINGESWDFLDNLQERIILGEILNEKKKCESNMCKKSGDTLFGWFCCLIFYCVIWRIKNNSR